MKKLTSARFIMAVAMTLSGCIMAYNNKLSTEFATIWGVVIASYFGRADRDVSR